MTDIYMIEELISVLDYMMGGIAYISATDKVNCTDIKLEISNYKYDINENNNELIIYNEEGSEYKAGKIENNAIAIYTTKSPVIIISNDTIAISIVLNNNNI